MSEHYLVMVEKTREAERVAAKASIYAKDMRSKLEKAKKVLTDLGFPMPDVETSKIPLKPRKFKGGPPKSGQPTWTGEITKIVSQNGYISYSEMKETLALGPLSIKLSASDKGFYGALLKLEKRNVLVRHNSHAFTPEAYERYANEVAKGLREEVKGVVHNGGGAVSEPIIKFLEANAVHITASDLCSTLEFSNQGSVYNALKRLVDEGTIIRDENTKTYRHSHHEATEPKTAVLVTPPSREGELPLSQPSR